MCFAKGICAKGHPAVVSNGRGPGGGAGPGGGYGEHAGLEPGSLEQLGVPDRQQLPQGLAWAQACVLILPATALMLCWAV